MKLALSMLDKASHSKLTKHSEILTWLSCGDLFASQASARGLHPSTLSSIYTTPCNHIQEHDIITNSTKNIPDIKQL